MNSFYNITMRHDASNFRNIVQINVFNKCAERHMLANKRSTISHSVIGPI